MNTNTQLNNAEGDLLTPDTLETTLPTPPVQVTAPRPKPKRRLFLHQRDAKALIVHRHEETLRKLLSDAAYNGASQLIISLEFPDTAHRDARRVVTASINTKLPDIAFYAVVEWGWEGNFHAHFHNMERRSAFFSVWENACEELQKLHGTQKPGQAFQIAGYDAAKQIVASRMLQSGVTRKGS